MAPTAAGFPFARTCDTPAGIADGAAAERVGTGNLQAEFSSIDQVIEHGKRT